jgi:short-subunit dehydrogenase
MEQSTRLAETVLVTGATAGLGAEFARQFASLGCDLVLVARNAQRLVEMAAELRSGHPVAVETLTADLLTDEGLDLVLSRIRDDDSRPVTTLVNNAGFGLAKPFADNAWTEELDHLRIHATVPLALCHAALQGMRARRSGHIINVASVAGFTPRGTYGALKGAVISFSRWANLAYRSEGVKVTALCPGFVHTEFHERMQVDKSGVPRWMWLDAERVVAEALADTAAGKPVSVPSRRYRLLAGLARMLPASLLVAAMRRGW